MTMNIQVEITKVELKAAEQFDLHCKAQSTGSKEILTESSSVSLLSSNPSQAANVKLPTFKFRFKKPSQNAAFLFTALEPSTGGGGQSNSKEIGNCLFPITFHNPESYTSLGVLGQASVTLAKNTQVAFLSSKIEGSDVKKVVGKVWFKVRNLKNTRPKLKASLSWVDMSTVQDFLTKEEKSGPSLSELISREAEVACMESLPTDKPTVSVIYHSIVSARSSNLLTAKDLIPVACFGTTPGIRNDIIFRETGGEPRAITSLRPVTLRCSSDDAQIIELHMADSEGNKVIFSASHPLRTLAPFKHYNWDYNWRWMPGANGFSPSHTSKVTVEPNVTLSIVHRPSVNEYPNYEGLEVFVAGIEFGAAVGDKNAVLCSQLVDVKKAKSISEISSTHENAPYVRRTLEAEDPVSNSDQPNDQLNNFNMTVIRFKSEGMDDCTNTPAYYFFPNDPYFQSKRGSNSLLLSLYVTDSSPSRTQLWWKNPETATTTIKLSQGLKSILPKPENRDGVQWELSGSEITQAIENRPVATKIYGVIRWKTKDMKFLSPTIMDTMSVLPSLKDLDFPDTETTASPNSTVRGLPGGLMSLLPKDQVSDVSRDTNIMVSEEYKTALTKMGLDILKLRQENEVLKKENRDFERHILHMEESIIVTLADQQKLLPLPKADLIHKIMELSECLTTETQTRKIYQTKVRELQNTLIEKNDAEKQYVGLQEAHTAQQKLVRELQLKLEKYRKCSETCKQQEAVINQLESLLAHQGREHRDGEVLSTLSKENAHLRTVLKEYQELSPNHRQGMVAEKDETIKALKAELSQEKGKCQQLQDQVSDLSEHVGVESGVFYEQTSRVFELEQKIKVATAREKTVMTELEENAAKWAQEKARYEFQLAEYRAKVNLLEQSAIREPRHVTLNRFEPTHPTIREHSEPGREDGYRTRDSRNHRTEVSQSNHQRYHEPQPASSSLAHHVRSQLPTTSSNVVSRNRHDDVQRLNAQTQTSNKNAPHTRTGANSTENYEPDSERSRRGESWNSPPLTSF